MRKFLIVFALSFLAFSSTISSAQAFSCGTDAPECGTAYSACNLGCATEATCLADCLATDEDCCTAASADSSGSAPATSGCTTDADCASSGSGYVCQQSSGTCAKGTTSTPATNTTATGVNLVNPLATSDVRVIIGTLIKAALGLSGSLALVMFIWGGFMWLTSNGNAEKIEKGKQIIIWATLGLIFIFFGYTIVNAVISAITSGSVT